MPPTEPKFPNPPLDEIDPGTLLTVADAAAHFGVKPVTIRLWAHRGKITHVSLPGNGPRLYHLRPLALAEKDAWENGADRLRRGGRHPDWKPCTGITTSRAGRPRRTRPAAVRPRRHRPRRTRHPPRPHHHPMNPRCPATGPKRPPRRPPQRPQRAQRPGSGTRHPVTNTSQATRTHP